VLLGLLVEKGFCGALIQAFFGSIFVPIAHVRFYSVQRFCGPVPLYLYVRPAMITRIGHIVIFSIAIIFLFAGYLLTAFLFTRISKYPSPEIFVSRNSYESKFGIIPEKSGLSPTVIGYEVDIAKKLWPFKSELTLEFQADHFHVLGRGSGMIIDPEIGGDDILISVKNRQYFINRIIAEIEVH
jgi:hypothetical protein